MSLSYVIQNRGQSRYITPQYWYYYEFMLTSGFILSELRYVPVVRLLTLAMVPGNTLLRPYWTCLLFVKRLVQLMD